MRMKTLSLCGVVCALAGMPIGLAHADQPATTRHNQPDRGATASVNFETFGDIKGREVYNNAGKNVATIEDLIVDRGSGDIMHVVVKTGDVLGFGGKSVAIPYSEFDWNGAEQRVILDYSKDSVKDMAEFRADSWAGLLTEENAETYDAAYKQLRQERESWQNDPYADAARQAPTMTLEGTVRKVERPSSRSGEPAYIMLDTERNGTVKVLLGPSWYAMGYSGAPVRGEKVTVRAFEVPRADERMYVARSIKGDRGELTLRRTDGHAMWDQSAPASSGDRVNIPFRYVLLSQVVGQDCDARAQECGEVQTAIVECTSGQVAFLAIDPNENFLGIGDELHLVPWSVARIYADGVSIDASKDMIVNSAEMPDDLNTLEGSMGWQPAYRAFEVDAPKFKHDYTKDSHYNNKDSSTGMDGTRWYERADMRDIIKKGAHETISGSVKEVSTSKAGRDLADTSTIIVSTPGGEQEVIVGPKSYVSSNRIDFKKGETVTIEAVRAVIDGQSVWIAKSITTTGGRTHTLWNNDIPAWHKP